MNLLDTWYILDENSSPPTYKLKSLSDAFSNFHNRSKDNYDNHKTELDIWDDIYKNLSDIVQHGITESQKDFKTTQSIKFKNERYFTSTLELLINMAVKYSQNECLAIYRSYEGLNEKSKFSNQYIDVSSNGKLDKVKQDKLTKFRESLWNKLGDENKHHFNLTWKEDSSSNAIVNGDSNASNEEQNGNSNTTENSNDSNNNNNHSASSSEYNSDFRNYLQSFNEVIVTKVKSFIEKRINDENTFELNSMENMIYQEATRHLHRFQRLNEKNLFGLDEMYERVKKLINFSMKNEHFPIFIYGGATSGKSLTLTKFGNVAYNLIGVRSCLTVVRYFDLTSQCATFEGLLYSICEQLTVLQKLNPATDMPNKECNELVQYFHKICGQLSKGQKQLLILIDGIQDVYVDKSLLSKANIINNHLAWLFTQLPPKVHLIVSIKKQINLQKVELDSKLRIQPQQQQVASISSSTLTVPQNALTSGTTISLISHYFQEHLSSIKENYIFDLPLQIKDIKELNSYIRSELNKTGKIINDEQLQLIVDCLSIKTGQENNINSNNTAVRNLSTNSTSSDTSILLYLNFLLKQMQKTIDLKSFLTSDTIPRDIDALFKYVIDKLEKTFNSKILSFVFNYLTAAHNGLTEMELIDILSCNNDFFFDYYTHLHLPNNLRFPISLWVFIKHELGRNLKINNLFLVETFFF